MKRWKLLFTIFAVTFTTMLAEVLLTRVFSVIYFGQFAFLIISLALFGYGLSGVFLALRKLSERKDQATLLSRFLLLFVVSFPLAYKATLVFTIDFLHLFSPFAQLPFPGPQFPDPAAAFLFRGRGAGPDLFRLFREHRPPLFHRPGRGQPRFPGHHPAHPLAGPEPDTDPPLLPSGPGLVLRSPPAARRCASRSSAF